MGQSLAQAIYFFRNNIRKLLLLFSVFFLLQTALSSLMSIFEGETSKGFAPFRTIALGLTLMVYSFYQILLIRYINSRAQGELNPRLFLTPDFYTASRLTIFNSAGVGGFLLISHYTEAWALLLLLLFPKLMFTPYFLVLEKQSLSMALAHSWRRTEGLFFQIVGGTVIITATIMILFFALNLTATQLLSSTEHRELYYRILAIASIYFSELLYGIIAIWLFRLFTLTAAHRNAAAVSTHRDPPHHE